MNSGTNKETRISADKQGILSTKITAAERASPLRVSASPSVVPFLGLPPSTAINKPLPKKAVFDKFPLTPAARRLLDAQISRMAIVAEISLKTVHLPAARLSDGQGEDIAAVFVVLLTLKTPDCDKKNIALLAEQINQKMVFALQYENSLTLAVERAGAVFISKSKPVGEWHLNLSGSHLTALWENLIAQIAGINNPAGANLDAAIATREQIKKLEKEIAKLSSRINREPQENRRHEQANQRRQLQTQLDQLQNLSNHG